MDSRKREVRGLTCISTLWRVAVALRDVEDAAFDRDVGRLAWVLACSHIHQHIEFLSLDSLHPRTIALRKLLKANRIVLRRVQLDWSLGREVLWFGGVINHYAVGDADCLFSGWL